MKLLADLWQRARRLLRRRPPLPPLMLPVGSGWWLVPAVLVNAGTGPGGIPCRILLSARGQDCGLQTHRLEYSARVQMTGSLFPWN